MIPKQQGEKENRKKGKKGKRGGKTAHVAWRPCAFILPTTSLRFRFLSIYRSLMMALFASHSIEAGALRCDAATSEEADDGGVAVPDGDGATPAAAAAATAEAGFAVVVVIICAGVHRRWGSVPFWFWFWF